MYYTSLKTADRSLAQTMVLQRALRYKDNYGYPTPFAKGVTAYSRRNFKIGTTVAVVISGSGSEATYNYKEFWFPGKFGNYNNMEGLDD